MNSAEWRFEPRRGLFRKFIPNGRLCYQHFMYGNNANYCSKNNCKWISNQRQIQQYSAQLNENYYYSYSPWQQEYSQENSSHYGSVENFPTPNYIPYENMSPVSYSSSLPYQESHKIFQGHYPCVQNSASAEVEIPPPIASNTSSTQTTASAEIETPPPITSANPKAKRRFTAYETRGDDTNPTPMREASQRERKEKKNFDDRNEETTSQHERKEEEIFDDRIGEDTKGDDLNKVEEDEPELSPIKMDCSDNNDKSEFLDCINYEIDTAINLNIDSNEIQCDNKINFIIKSDDDCKGINQISSELSITKSDIAIAKLIKSDLSVNKSNVAIASDNEYAFNCANLKLMSNKMRNVNAKCVILPNKILFLNDFVACAIAIKTNNFYFLNKMIEFIDRKFFYGFIKTKPNVKIKVNTNIFESCNVESLQHC